MGRGLMTSDRALLSVTATPANIGAVRAFVRAHLVPDVGDDLSDDIVLVVSELVSNAVEHGSGGDVEIGLNQDENEVELVVSTEALDLPDVQDEPAAPDAAQGRGLHIVTALCDAVAVTATEGVVSVSCRFVIRR